MAPAAGRNSLGLRDPFYYAQCMVGGVLACGVTHAAVVSLDVTKCRTQAWGKSGLWPGGLLPGLSKLAAEEGAAGLRVGWLPTFLGYGAQGLFKFGLNEFFKDFYTNIVGEETIKSATWKKLVLWALASGSAEIFADVALCPFEMTKVKMQVSLQSQGPLFPRSLPAAFAAMSADKGTGFPFGSLKPLWARQVPYTMIKFVGFYTTSEWIYKQLDKRGVKASDLADWQKLSITFLAGYWAGIFCAIATQPADNLVSMKGNPANASKSFGQLAAEVGPKDLFLKGLSTRIIMIGTLTGLQWWIYGSYKNAMGFGTQ
eukprot:TRINITY_DN20766_c0_g1_i1.p1 TRINITY_DN20766_c0_g1~~TRINITY_DN20766_c0_g1_i1.p1  ORF type:complete len:315 (-),score=75.89 TRINITY_DN20766_c0_g1_i1:298-1242(-)